MYCGSEIGETRGIEHETLYKKHTKTVKGHSDDKKNQKPYYERSISTVHI